MTNNYNIKYISHTRVEHDIPLMYLCVCTSPPSFIGVRAREIKNAILENLWQSLSSMFYEMILISYKLFFCSFVCNSKCEQQVISI